MSEKGTVLWIGEGGAASPLAQRIAQDHRVVDRAASLPPGEFVLIGHSGNAAAALDLARSNADCAGLVLMAPVLATLPAPEAAPDLPILLLLGTDDTRVPPSAAGTICAALPRAQPILIYAAGHELDRERVEAVSAVIRDFIDRREKFIVREASDVLYP